MSTDAGRSTDVGRSTDAGRSTDVGRSTDTRRRRTRRRRGRAYAGSFAVVVGVLAALGLAGAAATTVQGPRVTDVAIDPAAAVAASGSRLILTTTQALEDVAADQVTVSPATPFTVDTSGRTVGLRFTLPLADDTAFTVRVDGVEGIGGGPTATIEHAFRTPPIDVFLLRRDGSGESGGAGDTIFRTDLGGEDAVAVFTHAHIEDFRATASHLVISTRDEDDTAELIVTDLDGAAARELPLPGDGYVTNLQSADRGELVGYTYSDRELNETTGRESALFTASLAAGRAGEDPTPVIVAGDDTRVAEWRFVPDTDRLLLLTFDGRLTLTDAAAAEPVSLGTALAIDGIGRGSSQAVVERADGAALVDLTDGTESALPEPAEALGNLGQVTPIPGGRGEGAASGTLRTYSVLDESFSLVSTTVVAVGADGGVTRLWGTTGVDAVLQTCVSPSGRYAAVLVAPESAANPYDTYELPMPRTVETRIVEIADAIEVVELTGFDVSWCHVPLR